LKNNNEKKARKVYEWLLNNPKADINDKKFMKLIYKCADDLSKNNIVDEAVKFYEFLFSSE